MLCDDDRQIVLTAFPNTVEDFLTDVPSSLEMLEDTLLQLGNVNFEFKPSRIITRMSQGDETLVKEQKTVEKAEEENE